MSVCVCVWVWAVWAACYKRLVSWAIASLCVGVTASQTVCACLWTRTHTLCGYSVYLFVCVCVGVKDTTLLPDPKFFTIPSLCIHTVVIYNPAVWGSSVYQRGHLFHCRCAHKRTHALCCSRLSCFSALSLSNDNYPSMVGALLLEMKMDWISAECAGRCVVAATRNYTVRTIEPPSTRHWT